MNMEELLDYELRSSSRYRRFVTVVVVVSDDKKIRKILSDYVRDSDESFEYDDSIAVLMGETDMCGSLKAVERYKKNSKLGNGVRYAVASYPNDGASTQDFLTTLFRRFNKAKTAHEGAIVSKD